MEEYLKQLIGLEIKDNEKVIVTVGTVKTVRENDCDVEREFRPELLSVRYHAINDELNNYIKITPKQGSKVLCAIIEGDTADAVIISHSEIEKIQIQIDGAEFEMYQGKFKIKNNAADLKTILKTGFETLKNAIITTPSGPGEFSVDNKAVFENQKTKVLQLFS